VSETHPRNLKVLAGYALVVIAAIALDQIAKRNPLRREPEHPGAASVRCV